MTSTLNELEIQLLDDLPERSPLTRHQSLQAVTRTYENQGRRVRQRTTAPPPSLTAIPGRTAADLQTVDNLARPDNTGTNHPAPTNRKRRKEELLRKILDVPQSSLTWLESLSDRDLLPRRQTPRTAPDRLFVTFLLTTKNVTQTTFKIITKFFKCLT